MTRHQLQLLIYLSALALAAGVFLPLTSFPVYGEVSYYRVAKVEAWLVVILALSGPAMMLTGRKRLSILGCIGVWLVLLYPALRDLLNERNRGAIRRLGDGMTQAMADFSADLFLNITEFEWGGLLLIVALLVFSASSIVYQFRL